MLSFLAACSSVGSPSIGSSGSAAPALPTASAAAPEESHPDASAGPSLVDGKLPTLADGFPDGPITLWNAFEPASTDDLFNISVARIANKYSPVRVSTASNSSGPLIQMALAEFLAETQPRADQGYDVFAVSWNGVAVRSFTLESARDKDVLTDLNPVTSLQFAPAVMVVPPDSEFQTLEDVEAWARENPGQLKVVGSASGSGLHVSALAWADQADIEFSYIPTEGVPQSRQTLLGGGAQFGVLTYQLGIEDQFRVLAVTKDQRVSELPDVRATSELGYNIPHGSERGYGVIPEVPEEHVKWLHQLFALVAADPEFAEEQAGFILFAKTPDEVRAGVQELLDVFVPILKDLGIATKDR